LNTKHLLAALCVGALLTGWAALVAQAADNPVGAEVVAPPAAPVAPATPAERTTVTAANPAAKEALNAEMELRLVIWSKAKALAQEYLDKAKMQVARSTEDEIKLSDDDFATARKDVAEAENVLQKNENVADPAELRDLRGQVSDIKLHVAKLEEKVNFEKAVVERDRAKEEERQRVRKAAQERAERINELFKQVDSARMENNYSTMQKLLEQVIAIEPNNKLAAAQLDNSKIQMELKDRQAIDAKMDDWTARTLLNVREAMTPYDDPIYYPAAEVWHTLVEQRKGFKAGLPPESPANQRVRDALEKTIPEVRFPAIKFEDALIFLRDLQRVNINPNWAAMEAAGITKTTEINLQLRDVTFEVALRELLTKAAGKEGVLDYMIRDGVIKVSTVEDLSTLKYILVYDVRDLLHPLTDFHVPAVNKTLSTSNNPTTIGSGGAGATGGGTGSSIFQPGGGGGGTGGTGGGAAGEEPDQSAAERKEKVTSFMELLRTSVLPDSWAPTGDANMKETDGLLVVKQTSNGHRELGKLLNQLREHSRMQISIEARFLTIESDFLEDIGFNLDFLFNPHSKNSNLSVLPVDVGTFPHSTFQHTGANIGQFVDGSGASTLTPIGSGDIFQVGRPSLVMAGSFMDDLNVDFFLRATQAHQQSSHLNALRVTLMNGHEAYVLVQTATDYVASLTPTVATAAFAYSPTVDQLIKGVSFGVRATVTADRKYVIMTVYPTLRDDSLAGTFTFAGGSLTTGGTTSTGTSGGTGASSSGSSGQGQAEIQLRAASIQEVRTTVMVPDRGTLVLGGQRLADELEVETGVPVLSKIPIIKNAFTSRSYVKRERTLLILIRPQILIPEEMEP
jgi:general secretion pathway protein D